MNAMEQKDRFIVHLQALQESICRALEEADGKAFFHEDPWDRPGGGGGLSRVISGGAVFEKGGVNLSVVHGSLPESMQSAFQVNYPEFMAAGVSLVIHPLNPYVPTVHANWRYFELYDQDGLLADCWFGGGTDLTPYYIFPEDAEHFHRTLKEAMDPFGAQYYPLYKKQCDDYFVNHHRDKEARGIGGVFYDYLRPDKSRDWEALFSFQQANGLAFLPAYLPIVYKRRGTAYGDAEKWWQEYRRGRYVEFNLVHDRGTLFGLKTQGRIESILMSMPPRARWEYNYVPEAGTREAELLKYLKPRDWVH